MLFVDHDESELLEGDVGAQQPVRPDDDIDSALPELLENRLLLFRRLESAQHRDAHREIREPLAEGARVLIGENRRRHENGDLTLGLHRLERRAHGHLGLPISNIPHEQPVHRPNAFHIFFHIDGCLPLVRRVLEEKGRLELRLPRRRDRLVVE